MSFYSILQRHENNPRIQDIIQRIGIPQFLIDLDKLKNEEDVQCSLMKTNISQHYDLLKPLYPKDEEEIERNKNDKLRQFRYSSDEAYERIQTAFNKIKQYINVLEEYIQRLSEEQVANEISKKKKELIKNMEQITFIKEHFANIRIIFKNYMLEFSKSISRRYPDLLETTRVRNLKIIENELLPNLEHQALIQQELRHPELIQPELIHPELIHHHENNSRIQDILERIGIPKFLTDIDNFKNEEYELYRIETINIIEQYNLLIPLYPRVEEEIEAYKTLHLQFFKRWCDELFKIIEIEFEKIKLYITSHAEDIFSEKLSKELITVEILKKKNELILHLYKEIPFLKNSFANIRKDVKKSFLERKKYLCRMNDRLLEQERIQEQKRIEKALLPELKYSNIPISRTLKDNIDINKLRIEIKKAKATKIKYKSIIYQKELLNMEENDNLVMCIICYKAKNFYFEQNVPSEIESYLKNIIKKQKECINEEEPVVDDKYEPIIIINCGHTYHLTCYNILNKKFNKCVKCQNKIKSAVILKLK